jgi:crotonobetainyl-CoA:carnitine CoA-transferase CaiB-like acyl-CoA transferase
MTEGVYTSSANQPLLEGIRAHDLSRVLAEPYCTMMLGDLGVEIVPSYDPAAIISLIAKNPE